MADLNDSEKDVVLFTVVSSNNKHGHRSLNGMIIAGQYEVQECLNVTLILIFPVSLLLPRNTASCLFLVNRILFG
jgi:hypothetical protein